MTFDSSVLPLGERAWRSILDHVVAVGDAAETTYLEVKSDIDVTSKAGTAKVAKFLLGAANRLPHEAARHFHGYAVLVIGAAEGNASGVPKGTEAHELEDRLRPYLGPQFPQFEFGRISVADDREVLFVIAQPPQDGQPIFPCHKDFQGDQRRDNLEDGAIYVRGSSNTRAARAGEVLALVERAKGGGKPPIELDVQITGPVNRVSKVDKVMKLLYDHEEEKFAKPEKPSPASSMVGPSAAMNIWGSQSLSQDEREARLRAWQRKRPQHIARGREYLLGLALPGCGIQVESKGRFVSRPHLVVTFHECVAYDYRDDDPDLRKLVEPIVRPRAPFGPGSHPDMLNVRHRDYPVAWENTGNDVEVVLTPESLRPDSPWSSDQDDYTLVARDPEAGSVTMTWTLTEEGSDGVTNGELLVPISDTVDAAALVQDTFPTTE
ncbi:hypothetical protein QWJ06_05410 [Kocuria rhizophila]|uniref:hypothetical protein n=1 Tax=Kocuria rhizophila TaxID=72000 RepID=UPI001ABDBEEB|nr:hypothetical protein [Kocuria rhizophila]MBO4145965.1 hypothetical protein [Kocuria rhizophila]MDN3226154.1 hypothetical protein [Kocuria rhizophila]QTK32190.1 hypothetical protein J5U48_03470 [Kocuria rhizophila]